MMTMTSIMMMMIVARIKWDDDEERAYAAGVRSHDPILIEGKRPGRKLGKYGQQSPVLATTTCNLNYNVMGKS